MAYSKQMLRVLRARERVANRDRWFADIIYNVPVIECPDIATMDTNGLYIRFNPAFVDKINAKELNEEVEAVFCHEGWHIILFHLGRRGTRDARDWNIACDAIVNPMVRRRGWHLPKGAVFIKEVEADRMSAEKAYEYIKRKRAEAEKKRWERQQEAEEWEEQVTEKPEDGDNEADECNDCTGDNTVDLSDITDDVPEEGSERMKEPTEEELDEFNQKIQRSIQSATEKAISRGDMDDQVARALKIDDTTAPPLNWKEILEDMVQTNRNDEARTWARPNRRYLGQGEIRPGYLKDQINNLIVLYDTSGSVNDEANQQMMRVTADLLVNHTVSSITMISVDDRIRAIGEVFSEQEVLDFDLNIARGGTDFASAMKKVGEIEDKIGVVFLTDMQTCDFGPDPMVPVVWVNWGPEVSPGHHCYPPYGRVVEYKVTDDE